MSNNSSEEQCTCCNEISTELKDSITGEFFFDPVAAADGHIYEREPIVKWIAKSQKSPKTGEQMQSTQVYPVQLVKNIVEQFLHSNPDMRQEQYLPKETLLQLLLTQNDTVKSSLFIRRNPNFLTVPFEMRNHQLLIHVVASTGTEVHFDTVFTLTQELFPSKTKLQVLLQSSFSEGWTPLHCAVDSGNKATLKTILSHFTETDLDSVLSVWSPFMLKKPTKNLDLMMMDAAVKGDAFRLKLFLCMGANMEFVEPKYGFTALLWAISRKHIECVKILLQWGAKITATDLYQNGALHTAAFSGSVEIAELLLQAGCDMEARNQWRWTPLITSIARRHTNVARFFIQNGADVRVEDANGLTPTAWAIQLNLVELCDLIPCQEPSFSVPRPTGIHKRRRSSIVDVCVDISAIPVVSAENNNALPSGSPLPKRRNSHNFEVANEIINDFRFQRRNTSIF